VSASPFQDRETVTADAERSREILLACTSKLRAGLLGEGDTAAASFASAERLRGTIEQLSLPALVRCADSLTRWLDSPGGLARRSAAGFAEAAGDVVGLVEQCVDAALVGAPATQMDLLLARLDGRCEAVDDGATKSVGAGGGEAESFADDALDELDRCEDLLLRAELEGATREGIEALMVELAAVVDGGEILGVAGLDSGRFGKRLDQVGAEASVGGMIEKMLRCVDEVRLSLEIFTEDRGTGMASIPLAEFLKRLRRGCRDRAHAAGGLIQVELDADGMARVDLAVAQNFYDALLGFAAQAVMSSFEHRNADEVPVLRIRAGIDEERVQFEFEDEAVDEMVAGETVQSLDGRTAEGGRLPLHPYRRGYVNVVQVLVR